MNARILDLIKNPGIIQKEDLALLNSEIKKHPYLQNIRALHLLGTHQFDFDNYQKELSVTAAYTTDKKILYQFINKKEESIIETATSDQSSPTEVLEEEKIEKSPFVEIVPLPKPAIKPVFVEGNLNRILFEGEEDFLERENETIDIESTLESGKIVTQTILSADNNRTDSNENTVPLEETDDVEIINTSKVIKADENPEEELKVENKLEESSHELPDVSSETNNEITDHTKFNETEQAETFSKEKIIKEDKIIVEKTAIEDLSQKSFHEIPAFSPAENITIADEAGFNEIADAETFSREKLIEDENIVADHKAVEDLSVISFHGTEEFMPKVLISSNTSTKKQEAPKQNLRKAEIEMQQLIAEVEAKMKASKKEKVQEVDSIENHDINFSEQNPVQTDHLPEQNIEIKEEVIAEKGTDTTEIQKDQVENPVKKNETTPVSDQLAWQPMNFSANKPDSAIKLENKTSSEKEGKVNEKPEITEHTASITKIASEPELKDDPLKKEESATPRNEEVKELVSPQTNESNIPTFVNTWQNWLKIERKTPVAEEKSPVSKEVEKKTVIEKFIEKEPRISKLKEDSDFVVKEKGSNISHLMTETLANLYVEQKLYAKATKAYETLIQKHPKKEDQFRKKMKEIKELRKNF